MRQGYLPRPGPSTATRVILVVDDEVTIRRFVGTVLEREGFRALFADGAVEALEQLEKFPSIDLLLTDVRMPRMNGVDLAREIVRLRPAMRVIFMSGSCDDDYRSVTQEPLLAKPFRVAQLLDCVEAALTDRSVAIGA